MHLIPLLADHFADLNTLRFVTVTRSQAVGVVARAADRVSSGIELGCHNTANCAFFEIVSLIDVFIDHIFEPKFQFPLFREFELIVFTAHRYAKDPFSVLRDAVIFRIKYLPIVRITERRQKRKPTFKVGFEFLAHKILYVFQ